MQAPEEQENGRWKRNDEKRKKQSEKQKAKNNVDKFNNDRRWWEMTLIASPDLGSNDINAALTEFDSKDSKNWVWYFQ